MLCSLKAGLHHQPVCSLSSRSQSMRVFLLMVSASRRGSKSSDLETRKPLFQRFADEGSLDSLDLAISDWEEGLDEEFGAKVREIASPGFNLQKFAPSTVEGADAAVEINKDAAPAAASKRKFSRPLAGWYAMPGLTVRDLYLGILRHCEQGQVEVVPLYAIFQAARNKSEAGLCLSALSVCRIARLRRGILEPFHQRLAAAFIWMCVQCDAGDVLVECMERGPELGLQLSGRRVHMAMKLWGESGRLELLERIYRAMPAAGVAVSGRTKYTIMRTAMNLGRYNWVLRQMRAFREQQVPIQSALQSLEKVAEERLASGTTSSSAGEGDIERNEDLITASTSGHVTSRTF